MIGYERIKELIFIKAKLLYTLLISRNNQLFRDYFCPKPFKIPFIHIIDDGDVRIHFLLGVLVIVTSSAYLYSNSLRDVSDAF